MFETSLFKKIFVIVFVIALMTIADSFLYFTWIYWWYDMIMHFSAGASIGMATVLTCIYFSKYTDQKLKIVFYAMLAGFVIGLAWEIYELMFNLASFSDGMAYVTDTLSDLFLDTSGALLFSIYSLKYIKK